MGYPFCPVCTGNLELKDREKDIQEFDSYSLVTRECSSCHWKWKLKIIGRVVISVEGKDTENPDFGFTYICPHCDFESYVATVYRPRSGWNCMNCGKKVPNENLIPRGGYQLPEMTRVGAISSVSKRSSRRKRDVAFQRAPRSSKPVPTGAVSIATLAERIKVEPKKLRSWLRKVGWRKAEEAGSAWIFSPEEAEEVFKNFRG